MRTSRRTILSLLPLAPLLAGCGFRPLYAQRQGSASAALAKVRIERIPERSGQELRIKLQDMFDPTGAQPEKTYALAVSMQVQTYSTSIRQDNTSSRNNYDIRASFVMSEIATGRAVMDGTAHAISSYNILRSDYATASSENDARARAVAELAVSIQSQLAVYFDRRGA